MRLDFWDVLLAHMFFVNQAIFLRCRATRLGPTGLDLERCHASFVERCGVRCGLGTLVVEAGLHRPRMNVTQVILGVLVSRS